MKQEALVWSMEKKQEQRIENMKVRGGNFNVPRTEHYVLYGIGGAPVVHGGQN